MLKCYQTHSKSGSPNRVDGCTGTGFPQWANIHEVLQFRLKQLLEASRASRLLFLGSGKKTALWALLWSLSAADVVVGGSGTLRASLWTLSTAVENDKVVDGEGKRC